MKGWVFTTFGVDSFGQDVAPAHEEGVYLNFKRAFQRLCELNSKLINRPFFEEGYGEYYFPADDIELSQADEAGDWERFNALLYKHRITNIEEICSMFCVNKKPPLGLYAIEEIKIKIFK